MKRVLFIVLVTLAIFVAPHAMAQTPDTTNDDNGSIPALPSLTPNGAAFSKGASDGQCTTAGASCTTVFNQPGICQDNGFGSGVCGPINPTIDPLFDQGCKPNEICHIKPEKVGRRNEIGQSEKKDCGQTDCTGSLWTVVQSWIGDVKPQSIYHYGTALLSNYGYQMYDSFTKDLMPAKLQDSAVHDVAPKPYCMTSRLCVYNPVTGELVANFLTEETWCTQDPPGRRQLIEGMRIAASAMTRLVMPANFFALPITSVKKMDALPCNAKMEPGKIMELNDLTYVKKNYYGSNDVTHMTITILADMVSVIQKEIDNVLETFYVAHETTPAVEVGSAENGLAASLAGISFSVTMDDLQPFGYPKDDAKLALTTVGGVWNTYRNDQYDVTFKTPTDAIFDSQDWYYGIAGIGNIKSPTLQSMNARQQDSQTFGNCAILNADDPTYKKLGCDQKNWLASSSLPPPGSPNSSTWAQSTSPSSSATPISPTASHPSSTSLESAIAAAAAAYNIPACVLDGVATIEGAYDMTYLVDKNGDYSPKGSCGPNQCSAVGPFQITTGVGPSTDKKCARCGTGYCPNALPYLPSGTDPCDNASAAKAAASLLVGKASYYGLTLDASGDKAAIIAAGDSYYGSAAGISRLGGLSYGEWLYAHCHPTDPSAQIHTEHSLPPPGGSHPV